MTTKTTLQNIQDAITALKDGWVSTALSILEEARLDEMAKQQLMQAGIYPPGTQESVALKDALAEALTSVYVCGRVWEAWQYGTMSESDFQPAAECDEVLDSLVEAVTKATPPAAQPAQWQKVECPFCGDSVTATDMPAAQPDIETLEVENKMLRARNERLERELADLAERVVARLEQSGAGSNAGLIREVFINKRHP